MHMHTHAHASQLAARPIVAGCRHTQCNAVAAEYGAGDVSGVVSNGINLTFKTLTALLMFQTSRAFDRAIHNEDGTEVEHLMAGLGEEEGLGALFEKLTVLSYSLILGGVAGVVLPELMEKVRRCARLPACAARLPTLLVCLFVRGCVSRVVGWLVGVTACASSSKQVQGPGGAHY